MEDGERPVPFCYLLLNFFSAVITGIAGQSPAGTGTPLRTRKCRNQSCLNDSGIFDGHIAGALDFGRFAGVRVGVHSETGIAQPRYADCNFVLVTKDVSISIRQRFVRPNDRNVGSN